VGVTYEGRQVVVAQLQVGEKVYLVRDLHNPFDQNAIKVVRRDGQQFGFLNKDLAAVLSTRLDQYGRSLKASVSSLMGGYYADSNLGVVIKFKLPGN